MKLKGDWSGDTTYSVGDVVRGSDGFFHYLCKPCVAGTTFTDSLYWNRLEGFLSDCAGMIMDCMDILNAKIPTNINDEAITLKTDDGEYLVTVDDSGDTPELEVTEITEGD